MARNEVHEIITNSRFLWTIYNYKTKNKTMIYNNWVFGNKAGLNFPANPAILPPATGPFAMDTFESCTSISDQNGNLLFYTDGITVWDSAGTIRNNTPPNNIPLLGDDSSTQSSIIVPNPANSDEYYILTTDGSSNPNPPFNHFNGVIVDVTSWTFTRISTRFPSMLPSTTNLSPTERITAIQDDKCIGFWVITIVQDARTDTQTVGGGQRFGLRYI